MRGSMEEDQRVWSFLVSHDRLLLGRVADDHVIYVQGTFVRSAGRRATLDLETCPLHVLRCLPLLGYYWLLHAHKSPDETSSTVQG